MQGRGERVRKEIEMRRGRGRRLGAVGLAASFACQPKRSGRAGVAGRLDSYPNETSGFVCAVWDLRIASFSNSVRGVSRSGVSFTAPGARPSERRADTGRPGRLPDSIAMREALFEHIPGIAPRTLASARGSEEPTSELQV